MSSSFEKLFDLALQCRTVHQFKNEEHLPDDLIERVIQLSLFAPNHKYTFPWGIYRVGSDKRELLANLNVSLKEAAGEQAERIRAKILNPSELLVFTVPVKENKFEAREDYATISCSIQLLALALRSEGLGYKWSSGGMTSHEQTYKTLGIDSLKEEIVAFIWVGHCNKDIKMTKRPKVSEVLKNI